MRRRELVAREFVAIVMFLFILISLPRESMAGVCTVKTSITGVVGPATVDLLNRAQAKANELGCQSILLLVNTPGGNLVSTRMIVEKILNSNIPYLCLVSPAGGHAGSAGAILLQACHVNGAVEATNIGAATPVSGVGEQLSEDLRKKIVNDTRSWVEGIVRLRERNVEFGRQIVDQAKAVDSREAVRIRAIDLLVQGELEFLDKARGRKVILGGVKLDTKEKVEVKVGDIREFDLDFRYKLLDLIGDPQITYLLFMGSLALIYFEVTHPGMIAPGVLGAIGLVLSMISFHKLDVSWGGLALMLLGVAFLIAEIFVPSFGALGVGGIISFIVGGIFLFDPERTGFVLPLWLVLGTALSLGAMLLGVGYLAFGSFRKKKKGGFDDLIGEFAHVSEVDASDPLVGWIEIQGERWKVRSDRPLEPQQKVCVKSHKGLLLEVENKS